ncbi:hypothetical protein KIKIMORA_04390 [Brevundimonas phage vB_BpoS-Kikimora]|uniref:Uncharacterized protein n=1 Tax=Brevundimonas phage vB_BpoS-Kikimora TaxID=2948601 RepID=A0A9E7MT24_9CAUD|nr:hypothetical protein KIKIMORA_04390 [Brevundimonas phage vB_BpoS-Kikimora]
MLKPTLLTDADALDAQAKLHLKQVSLNRREWEEANARAYAAKANMRQAAKDASRLFDQANEKRRQHHRQHPTPEPEVCNRGPLRPDWMTSETIRPNHMSSGQVHPHFPTPPLAKTARVNELGFRAIGEMKYSRRRSGSTSTPPATWRERIYVYFHPEEGTPRYAAFLRWQVRFYPILALFDANLRKWTRANRATTV